MYFSWKRGAVLAKRQPLSQWLFASLTYLICEVHLRGLTSTKYNQLNCVTLHPLCAKINNNETLVCLEKVEFANMRQITRPHYHPLRSCVCHKCVSYGKCITQIKDDLSAVLLNFCQFLKLLTFSSSGYSELLVIFFISFFYNNDIQIHM